MNIEVEQCLFSLSMGRPAWSSWFRKEKVSVTPEHDFQDWSLLPKEIRSG